MVMTETFLMAYEPCANENRDVRIRTTMGGNVRVMVWAVINSQIVIFKFDVHHVTWGRSAMSAIIFLPILYWRHASNFIKYFPESVYISISHVVHDFIYRFPSSFNLFLGNFYLYSLAIFKNRIVGGFSESSFKSSSAHIYPAC